MSEEGSIESYKDSARFWFRIGIYAFLGIVFIWLVWTMIPSICAAGVHMLFCGLNK